MREFAGMGNLEVWYAHLEIEQLLQERSAELKPVTLKRTQRGIAKARTRDSMATFAKLTEMVDGKPRIVDASPLIVPIEKLTDANRGDVLDWLRKLVRQYRRSLQFDRRQLLEQFELVDFARKVVGVGSVGTRAWIALMIGHDGTEPLFIQMKEAEASVMEEFLGPSEFRNHGERVVTGQRLMQAASDIFLGWIHIREGLDGQPRDFYGRQLKDWKGSVEIDQMIPTGMGIYGRLCGWTLARAHARSGDRVAISSYMGKGDAFDRALLAFADAYAAQNESDYRRLVKAVESGRIQVQTGL